LAVLTFRRKLMPGIGLGNLPPRPPVGKAADKKSTPEKDRKIEIDKIEIDKIEIDEKVPDSLTCPYPGGTILPPEPPPCPDKIMITDRSIPTNISLMRIWLVNNNLKVTVIKQENY
jgi:hypothetical protein